MKSQDRCIKDSLANRKNAEKIGRKSSLIKNYKMNHIHYKFVLQICFI